jgi:CHAT domain-containing protein
LARARYLLLATHAWYEPSRPGRSHLLFGATGPGTAEDGRVSATELAGLDLRSDLTVVSACSTALGDASAVDGQFGFAYGLMLAGNRQALLTLWPVGDVSSAAFVTRFFQHLARLPHTRTGATRGCGRVSC